MTSRYEVTLNDKKLSSVNKNLLILDVAYSTSESFERSRIANRDGARLSSLYREGSSVTVTFELHIYDIQKRQAALADVIAWAKDGGELKINDRKDQSLQCVCEKLPAISVKNWTEPLTITFSAYAFPYWEETKATVATLSGKNVSGTIKVNGNAPKAYANVTVKATAAITSLTVKVGSSSIALSGISIAAGKTVVFSYDENKILSIMTGTTSLLSKRTAKSSDDLVASCGKSNKISVVASANVTATFSVKGAFI